MYTDIKVPTCIFIVRTKYVKGLSMRRLKEFD